MCHHRKLTAQLDSKAQAARESFSCGFQTSINLKLQISLSDLFQNNSHTYISPLKLFELIKTEDMSRQISPPSTTDSEYFWNR